MEATPSHREATDIPRAVLMAKAATDKEAMDKAVTVMATTATDMGTDLDQDAAKYGPECVAAPINLDRWLLDRRGSSPTIDALTLRAASTAGNAEQNGGDEKSSI